MTHWRSPSQVRALAVVARAAADAWNKARLAIKRAKRRNHRKTHGKAFGL